MSIHREVNLVCAVELDRRHWRDKLDTMVREKFPDAAYDELSNELDDLWADFESEFSCQNDSSSTLRLARFLANIDFDMDAINLNHALWLKPAPPTHKAAWIREARRWAKDRGSLTKELTRFFHDLISAAANSTWEYYLVPISDA